MRSTERLTLPRIFLLLLTCQIVLVMVEGAAEAQSGRKPQGKQPTEQPIIRLETREVMVPLRAYGNDGHFVDSLDPQDVLVLEEGESRPVSYIKREPASIILVLDMNNEIGTFKNGPTERIDRSERPVWESPQKYRVVSHPTTYEFAENFISALSPNDHLSVIQYAEKPTLVQDWTNDPRQAIRSLNRKYRVGLKGNLFDALSYAAEKLESRKSGRRVIVLVSDGLDTGSRVQRAAAMTALAKSRATIYVVGWAEALRQEVEMAAGWMYAHETHSSATIERILELRRHLPRIEAAGYQLRQLAESTGGEIWLPSSHQELIAAWRPLSAEIGAQFTLAFISETKPSMEPVRSIQVLPARNGLSVRSSKTYYADN